MQVSPLLDRSRTLAAMVMVLRLIEELKHNRLADPRYLRRYAAKLETVTGRLSRSPRHSRWHALAQALRGMLERGDWQATSADLRIMVRQMSKARRSV